MRISLRSGEPIEITAVAERPDLAGAAINAGEWPEFMRHNRLAEAYFWETARVFSETCLIATSEDGAVVADAHAVRFASGGTGREALPAGGWEQVTVWAFANVAAGAVPDTASALNISVEVSRQGQGLARSMLDYLRNAVRDLGITRLIAPRAPDVEGTRAPYVHGRVHRTDSWRRLAV